MRMDALRTGKQVLKNLKAKDPQHEKLLCYVFRFITNKEGLEEKFRDGIRGLYKSIKRCFPRKDEKIVVE
jgi:hypothetical protein